MRNDLINILHTLKKTSSLSESVWFGIIMRTFAVKMILLHVYLLHKQCMCLGSFCPPKFWRIISTEGLEPIFLVSVYFFYCAMPVHVQF